MRYALVIEKANENHSAYVPDLPGCIATGETVEDAQREIRVASHFHIEGLRADGLDVPQPSSITEYVNIERRTARGIRNGGEMLGRHTWLQNQLPSSSSST